MLQLITYLTITLPQRLAARVRATLTRRRAGRPAEAGMATAEYAVVTLAAVAFAALLLGIMRSGELREALLGIIKSALSVE